MGKFQSKQACRRRESPEGDSFVVNAYANRRGLEEVTASVLPPAYRDVLYCGGVAKELFPEEVSSLSTLQTPLSPGEDEAEDGGGGGDATDKKPADKAALSALNFQQELQCDVLVQDNNRQEWTFTLYDFDNSGKVTREDISSLMHTIYEVVGTSVNHSTGNSKTLRVKLTVTPDPGQQRRRGAPHGIVDQPPSHGQEEEKATPEEARQPEKKQQQQQPQQQQQEPQQQQQPEHPALWRHNSGQPQGSATARHCCCADENVERRNHYLDLAGMESYGAPVCSPAQGSPRMSRRREAPHDPEPLAGQPGRRAAVLAQRNRTPPDTSTAATAAAAATTTTAARHVSRSSRTKGPAVTQAASSRPGRQRGRSVPLRPVGVQQQQAQQQPQQQQQHKRHRQRGREGCLSPGRPPHYQARAPVPGVPDAQWLEQPQHHHHQHLQQQQQLHLQQQQPGAMQSSMLVPVMQRHEHHHYHEHHHHHHYHHYYET
ncbi:protein naked cuticle homolog 2 isoform X3 [Lethenteron reissneri]|uniref:protein naked cuticle homolog 2 isoform X3 n=1 Tax=Lethenteron reissneri TaxID=7753 RepID=UPI002AB66671|nr:protein naked cuticle homolog 2 isoform X3 [Lethenteron reissneri]